MNVANQHEKDRDAHERGAFKDLRLVKPALDAIDDGYAETMRRALPVLTSAGVPATVFVSTDHVRQNKCFWWDVLYRERLAQGASPRKAYGEGIAMKSKTTEQIERELKVRFGADSFALSDRLSFDPERQITFQSLPTSPTRYRVQVGSCTQWHSYGAQRLFLTFHSPQDITSIKLYP